MSFIKRLFFFFLFFFILVLIIAYARGYRFNLKEKNLNSTGIISINSSPQASKVYVNDILKGVTNLNLQLLPGEYKIEIKKDGYTNWQKKIKVKGELVYTINAQLFPVNPSLTAVTNLGITKAVAIDQTEKILIFSDNNNPEKDGIYLFEAGKRPLSLFPPLKLLVLKKDIPLSEPDFNKAEINFSADYKEVIIELTNQFFEKKAFLINLEGENNDLLDVTSSKENLLLAYNQEKIKEVNKILESFPKEISKIATNSFDIIAFSPDKTKLLYQAKKNLQLPLIIKPALIATNQTPETRNITENNFYLYDKKEDKNYQLKINLKNNQSIQWYPNSRQLVFLNDKKISLVDYDGENQQTIYSGPFKDDFFNVVADGKIIILVNLNPENNQLPDLYTIDLRS